MSTIGESVSAEEMTTSLVGTPEMNSALESALSSDAYAFLIRGESSLLALTHHRKACDGLQDVLGPYGYKRVLETDMGYVGTGKQFHIDGLDVLPYWQVHTTLDIFETGVAATMLTFATFWPTEAQHRAIAEFVGFSAYLAPAGMGTYLDEVQAMLVNGGLGRLESDKVESFYANPSDTLVFKNGYRSGAEYSGQPLIFHYAESVDVDTHQPNEHGRYTAGTRLDPYA